MKKSNWKYHHFTPVYQKSWSYALLILRYEQNKCNCCFPFWAIFCPFTPLTAQNIKFRKNEKKRLEIPSFYTCVPKIMIICYTVPEIWHVTDVIIIFNFRPFFAILPTNSPQIKIQKTEKKTPEDIIFLHMCTKNYDQIMYGSWDMVRIGRMDRKTDWKSDI